MRGSQHQACRKNGPARRPSSALCELRDLRRVIALTAHTPSPMRPSSDQGLAGQSRRVWTTAPSRSRGPHAHRLRAVHTPPRIEGAPVRPRPIPATPPTPGRGAFGGFAGALEMRSDVIPGPPPIPLRAGPRCGRQAGWDWAMGSAKLVARPTPGQALAWDGRRVWLPTAPSPKLAGAEVCLSWHLTLGKACSRGARDGRSGNCRCEWQDIARGGARREERARGYISWCYLS